MLGTTDQSRRAAMAAAILNRADASSNPLPQNHPGFNFRSMDLGALARECLHAAGVNTNGMSRSGLAIKALSSSDLPAILGNVITKSLRDGYNLATPTYTALGNKMFLPDFKDVSRVQLGDAPLLQPVMEGGEYEYGVMQDGAETYRLSKYGRILGITWEMIINDDLNAIARIPKSMGSAARQLENQVFWKEVIANPEMSDGFPIWSTAHGNVSSVGEEILIPSIADGHAKMRQQKSSGGSFLSVRPKYLVVPAALETRALQFTMADLVPQRSADINPFAGRLEVVTEPHLDTDSATAWYLWADPATIDTFEYAFLQGHEGPYIEQHSDFERDGLAIKVRHQFAVKCIEHRGLYRNAGA